MAESVPGRSHPSLKSWCTPTAVWLMMSLAIAVVYRLPALHNAFSATYVVQDDARQHVFWMQRFLNPDLFPQDLFADYFQSVAPWGYTTFYHLAAKVGIDPWVLNKILPVVIALVATGMVFFILMELTQMPPAAFVSAMFFNQMLPVRDDVVAATPVAFFHPFFLAFLLCLLRRWWWPGALSILLLGWFYPQGVLVMAATLGLRGLTLVRWQKSQLTLTGTKADYWVIGSGLLAAFLALLPYALQDSAYGPVLTVAQARDMFALSPSGWSKFFDEDFADFWLFGKRTGLLPLEWSTLDLKVQPQVWLTLALPFLLAFPGRSTLPRQNAGRIALLLQVAIASTLCFLVAHLLLFQLHLPNRYTEHSFRAIAALGAGVAIALILERRRLSRWSLKQRSVGLTVLLVWALAPLVVGLAVGESRGNYIHGQFPELYQYLQGQPADVVTAGLDAEINNLPSFTNRSIFVGGQGFALPYHLGYYEEVSRRSVELITAQYSADPAVVKTFLNNNAIDFWLVSEAMFTPEWIQTNAWLRQYARSTEAPQQAIANPQATVLEGLIDRCAIAPFDSLLLLETACLKAEL
ncbi:MAG: hypothetical protein ACFB12_09025 [Leptolyngbyaceae cyanobacterium]